MQPRPLHVLLACYVNYGINKVSYCMLATKNREIGLGCPNRSEAWCVPTDIGSMNTDVKERQILLWIKRLQNNCCPKRNLIDQLTCYIHNWKHFWWFHVTLQTTFFFPIQWAPRSSRRYLSDVHAWRHDSCPSRYLPLHIVWSSLPTAMTLKYRSVLITVGASLQMLKLRKGSLSLNVIRQFGNICACTVDMLHTKTFCSKDEWQIDH